MTAALPLVEQIVDLGAFRVCIWAAIDQDALLHATRAQDNPPFGLMLWESSVVLARHLATHDLTGKHVLELGAGVGLAGIAAARAGATVLQMDYDPLALALCARNADANGVSARISQQQMNWHTMATPERFDIIVGADILYDRDDHPAISRVVTEMLAPEGRVYLADPMRPHTADFLIRLSQQHWHVAIDIGHTPDLTRPAITVPVQRITCRR
jgi:methyltransferase-like protein 23